MLLTAAAHELWWRAKGTACAKVHVVTLHEQLLELTGSFRI